MKRDRVVTVIGILILIAPLLIYLPNFYSPPKHEETVTPGMIRFVDIKGDLRDVLEFRGKMVIIEFMVTNNTTCRYQVRNILSAIKGYEDNVTVIQLSIANEKPMDLYRYMLLNHVESKKNWIVGNDYYGVYSRYHLTGVPSIMVINPYGKVVLAASGLVADSTLRSLLKMYFGGK